MSFRDLLPKDVDALRRACVGDQATPRIIEALCSSELSKDVRKVVEKSLLRDGGTKAFATGLARGIRRLRVLGDKIDRSSKGRVLRTAGVCLSKVLETDLPEPAPAELHRGLRHSALLLALTEVVRDNDCGSAAQRAAAAALVAFCEGLPALWKELAKEIRADATLLKGFLGQLSTLPSITDHHTQELAFESVYRMWKVWKKQPGGPPVLPSDTRSELKEALSSMSTTNFESQIRAMLAAINDGGGGDRDKDEIRLPASFPVEEINQVTYWTGLGCEQGLGEAKWLDVGSDSVSLHVRPNSKQGRSGGLSSDAFISIPAHIVASSNKLLVGTRTLRVEVPFKQCPALARLAQTPPDGEQTSDSCILAVRLGGGSRHFSHLRKAIASLASTVAKDADENTRSTPAKVSMTSSKHVLNSPSGTGRRITREKPTPATPRGIPSTSERKGAARDSAKSAAPCRQGKQSKGDALAALITPPLVANQESTGPKTSASTAPTPKKKTTPIRKGVIGGSDIVVSHGMKSMVRGDDWANSKKATKGFRNIAQGDDSDPDQFTPGGNEQGKEQNKDTDSWMEPRRHLDLVPATSSSSKNKVNTTAGERKALKPVKENIGANAASAITTKPHGKGNGWNKTSDAGDKDDDVVDRTPRKEGKIKREKEVGGGNHYRYVEKQVPPRQAATPSSAGNGASSLKKTVDVSSTKASGRLSSSTKNYTEKLHTKNVPTKSSKKNDSDTCASDRGKQNNAQQSKGKEGHAVKSKTAELGLGATSRSPSAADEVSWGTPDKLSRNPTMKRPRREAASKAMKAMSPALSFSSVSEGESEWSQLEDNVERDSSAGDELQLSQAEHGYDDDNKHHAEADAKEGHADDEDGGDDGDDGDGADGDDIITKLASQESGFSMDAEGDEDEQEQVVTPSTKKAQSSRSRDTGTTNKVRVHASTTNGLEAGRTLQQRLAKEKQGEREPASEELEEAVSQTCDSSDEELSEHSVSQAGKPNNCSTSRDTGEAHSAQGKSGEGLEDEYDIEGEDHDEEQMESQDCGVEEEDSMMLAQLLKQFVQAARARDERSKKRKTDAAIEETRRECREYLELTSRAVTGHWRHQLDELLEQGRQAEEELADARERIRALARQQETQWQASRDRIQKHASTLKRMEAQLGPEAGVRSRKLEREWQGQIDSLRDKLQKHRDAAVARFSTTVADLHKKKSKHATGGVSGVGAGGSTSIASLLNHLTVRSR